MNTQRIRTDSSRRWGVRLVSLGGLLAVMPLVLSMAYFEFVNSFPAEQRLSVLVWSKFMQFLPIFQQIATFSVAAGILLCLFGVYVMVRPPMSRHWRPRHSSSPQKVRDCSRVEDDSTIFAV